MDKEKIRRVSNMRRFPMRLKQAKDTEYKRVYMYLEDEVVARIQELEEENTRLRKALEEIRDDPGHNGIAHLWDMAAEALSGEKEK